MIELYAMLVALAVKSTAVLLAATAAQAVLRRGPAAVRHLTWTFALAAILVLPAGSLGERWISVDATGAAASVLRGAAQSITVSAGDALPWREGLAALWLAGAVLLAARFAASSIAAARLRARAQVVDRAGAIPVLLSAEIASPVALGVIRPSILVPAAFTEWSAARRRVVLLHEAAHIERGDLWAHLAAGIAKAIYWYNPLVWFAAARLEDERERACDDFVLAAGEDACTYADTLIAVARSMQSGLAAPGIPMTTPSRLESRLRAILDSTIRRASITRAALAAATVATLAISIPLAVLRAQPAEPLSGRVLDASGAAVRGALVSLRHVGGAIQHTAVTTGDGAFAFSQLQPGPYMLGVEKTGYAISMLVIPLGANERVRKDVTLAAYGSNPKRIRLGGDAQATRLVHQIRPTYPPEAKRSRTQGKVALEVVILRDGTVGDIQLVASPHEALTRSAVDAVRQWTYRPTLLNGQPIEVLTRVDVNYTLTK